MADNVSRSNHNDLNLNNESKHNIILQDLLNRVAVLEKANTTLEASNNDLLKTQERGAFTLVLIDGDAVNFSDELIHNGFEGGEDAAKRLLSATREEVRHEVRNPRASCRAASRGRKQC